MNGMQHGSQSSTRPIVPLVVRQHVEDAAVLFSARALLARRGHLKLHQLRRFDDRLAAHLDGLSVAGEQAKSLCDEALEVPSAGAIFVAASRALETRNEIGLRQVLALVQSVPESRDGLLGAFGWTDKSLLRGTVAALLESTVPAERALGIAACAMHRVDPSLGSARLLEDADASVRARSYRAAGELGKREFLSRLGAAVKDEDPDCSFWAARSAVLLGDRHNALEHLATAMLQPNPYRARAQELVLMAMPPAQAHEQLRRLAADPAQLRWLIEGVGVAGDPSYIPWLMQHMANDQLARVAGQSFSLMTGADLAWLDLERKPPEQLQAGPSDDPNDANVEMDEDDDLPWPDAQRIQRWWAQNSSRFPVGQRYFVGAPVSREHCIEVLKTGYQRQRILAAHHLCLSEPSSVLFEWRAPSWRQAQALATLE